MIVTKLKDANGEWVDSYIVSEGNDDFIVHKMKLQSGEKESIRLALQNERASIEGNTAYSDEEKQRLLDLNQADLDKIPS